MNDDDNVYYKFSFNSFDSICNPNSVDPDKSALYSVFTDDIKKMQIFLKQHCFDDECMNFIKVADASAVGCSNELEEFILKTNSSDEIFTILTTQEIVDIITENISSDYVPRTSFGQVILREDIPIIKLIHSLLDEMPHMWVYEDKVVDDVDYMNRFGEACDEIPDDSYDDKLSYICESLYDYNKTHAYTCDSMCGLNNSCLLSFTIEAYSKYFTCLMT